MPVVDHFPTIGHLKCPVKAVYIKFLEAKSGVRTNPLDPPPPPCLRACILPPIPLTVMGNTLDKVSSFKYLCVWITKDLSWSKHVSEVCIKAKKLIRLIYRQYYQHNNTDTLKQLYMSSVRPHLEYATAVWDPHLQKDINKLEKVQTFALRMCTKNWTADYDSLLTSSNLPSLKKRRLFL